MVQRIIRFALARHPSGAAPRSIQTARTRLPSYCIVNLFDRRYHEWHILYRDGLTTRCVHILVEHIFSGVNERRGER
jgi:hypothetical protein